MRRFEYRVLDVSAAGFWGPKIDVQSLVEKLNELGNEGWEVVSVVDTDIYGGGTKGLLVTLKRELLG